MKSTNHAQTTETVNQKAIAPAWQSCIVEDLNDDAQAAVSGGRWPVLEVSGTDDPKFIASLAAGLIG
jgi:hypothetical protein